MVPLTAEDTPVHFVQTVSTTVVLFTAVDVGIGTDVVTPVTVEEDAVVEDPVEEADELEEAVEPVEDVEELDEPPVM